MSDGRWKTTMAEFAVFGDPARFEIAVRWTSDSEPRAQRPAIHGWSIGDLRLTVADKVVTRSHRGAIPQTHIGWYLLPLFDWLASNWIALLHEEDFAWHERSGAPAIVACHRALDRWIGARDADGRTQYKAIQAWYFRHGIRSAAEGGLFPDLFIRRYLDDIEVSWSSDAPLFAPDGFAFVSEPGVARLPVDDVAIPLWQALNWVASQPPPRLEDADQAVWKALSQKIKQIAEISGNALDRVYVDERILELARASLLRIGRTELIEDDISASRPFVSELSPAVAMFGGVSPRLGPGDVDHLCRLLADRSTGHDANALAALVTLNRDLPLGIPHQDGYSFAEDFLSEIGLPDARDWIDVRSIVEGLGIEILEHALETDSIRGVALAGTDFSPTILVNTTSAYNASEYGKRFTLAHELCHVIFDRTRARRVTHVSGPWAVPGIERRANAFAAFLLMPRALVVRGWHRQLEGNPVELSAFAERLHVNETALIEHLYNLDLIDEMARERLRAAFKIQ
jgi:Zn-dependent peptidase ImmA (M78 family)